MSKEEVLKLRNVKIKKKIRDLTFPDNPSLFGDTLASFSVKDRVTRREIMSQTHIHNQKFDTVRASSQAKNEGT